MPEDRYAAAMLEHYGRGEEEGRLVTTNAGQLEFERTQEIVLRRLPAAPAVIADIGGGPGRYALWLAGLGYRVVHRDVVPLHVEELLAAAAESDAASAIDSAVGDARSLDLADSTVDAVLLLGPLYHLTRRADRIQALREARRVGRPGVRGGDLALGRPLRRGAPAAAL
jgi:SAM-dependent methyltransferase